MNHSDLPLNARSALLSEREREVLFLAAEGQTDKEIAASLGIGAKTVRTYWDRMRAKLGAASRTQALAMALRAAYEELADKEARFRLFVEKLPVVFLSVDDAGQIEYFNEEARRVFGENASRNPQQILERAVDDVDIRHEVMERYVHGRERASGYELELRTPQGELRKVAWYLNTEHDPQESHYLAVGVDVTASQGKVDLDLISLRTLVQHSAQPIWLVNADFSTRFVNQAMAHLLGASLEKLETETPLQYVAKDDVDAALALVERGGGINVPFRFRRCDGSFIPVRKTLVPVLLHGSTAGFLILASEEFAK